MALLWLLALLTCTIQTEQLSAVSVAVLFAAVVKVPACRFATAVTRIKHVYSDPLKRPGNFVITRFRRGIEVFTI